MRNPAKKYDYVGALARLGVKRTAVPRAQRLLRKLVRDALRADTIKRFPLGQDSEDLLRAAIVVRELVP